jgi:hypothetical protein
LQEQWGEPVEGKAYTSAIPSQNEDEGGISFHQLVSNATKLHEVIQVAFLAGIGWVCHFVVVHESFNRISFFGLRGRR